MITQPPTDEQKIAYKSAYKAYMLASAALHAARQPWLPDQMTTEDARSDSQYCANYRIQEQIITEVKIELGVDG